VVSSAFLTTHKSNIALWSGFFVVVLFCYHLFSDGDFSFLMVRPRASSLNAQTERERLTVVLLLLVPPPRQTLGSFVRAFGFIFLIFKAFSQRSVAGLSLKTLELYAFVFLFRLSSILRYQGYLPYDRTGDWLYSLLEIIALVLCCGVIYLVTVRFNSTYELRYDTFGWLHVPTELGALYILLPCILLGMVSGAASHRNAPGLAALTLVTRRSSTRT
jgi:ER lumen protein retaining receptor